MNLAVLGPRVFIRPDKLPELTSDGRLHLVYDRQTSTMTGTVVAVGDGPDFVKAAALAVLNDAIDRISNKYVQATLREIRDDFQPAHVVEVGERVMFSPDSGEELIFEKDLLVCMKEDDILAVIDTE